jgi:glycerol-3-phosphate dehydrogenase
VRQSLETLKGSSFDVLVVGAGANGASAAQQLTAAGYSVLLVDKGDFGSGSSSRSTRMMHCGLRYLAPGKSMFEFVREPRRLRTAVRMARSAMQNRAEFVENTPTRALATNWFYPIYRNGPYSPWQVDLAFAVLKAVGPKAVPLGYKRLPAQEALQLPLLKWLREPSSLQGAGQYTEYLYDWPERICVDAAMEASRLGAEIRNYTEVTKSITDDEGWVVTLRDTLSPAPEVPVRAKIVLNTAGIWIDEVNRRAVTKAAPRRRIAGTKGVHVMFRLPAECQGYGMTVINRVNQPINLTPWRGMHYFGPTETLFDGTVDEIEPLDDEIDWLVDEANFLLPTMPRLKRSDVLFSWAGVRPLTYDPAFPEGKRSRDLHNLEAEGMPNFFALTGGPIMTHRTAGAELTRVVQDRLAPTRKPAPTSFAAPSFPENQNSPPLLDDYTDIKISDLRHAAAYEHVSNLSDLLFRRVGAGWTSTMSVSAADKAAKSVADILGWDEARIASEVAAYRLYLAQNHKPLVRE